MTNITQRGQKYDMKDTPERISRGSESQVTTGKNTV